MSECVFICVFMFNPNIVVKSPNSTCTQSSSSTCNGHGEHHSHGFNDHFNNDATFEVEDTNNYNMRLSSVEHQYEAIKDDGPDLKNLSNGRQLQLNHELLHSEQYRSRQINHNRGTSL